MRWSLFFILIFFSMNSSAEFNCPSLFMSKILEEQAFNEFSIQEEALLRFKMSVEARRLTNAVESLISKLDADLVLISEELVAENVSYKSILHQLDRLNRKIADGYKAMNAAEFERQRLRERFENTDFKKVIEDPTLLLGNRIYSVDVPKGTLKVSFSTELTEGFFHDADFNTQRLARIFLRAISQGIVPARGMSGVKFIKGLRHQHLYEVKIVGHKVESRLLGALDSNHLFVFDYSPSHLEKSSDLHRVIEKLNRLVR